MGRGGARSMGVQACDVLQSRGGPQEEQWEAGVGARRSSGRPRARIGLLSEGKAKGNNKGEVLE